MWSVWVVLQDDLVGVCKVGDNVTVIGIVLQRWRPCKLEQYYVIYHIAGNIGGNYIWRFACSCFDINLANLFIFKSSGQWLNLNFGRNLIWLKSPIHQS